RGGSTPSHTHASRLTRAARCSGVKLTVVSGLAHRTPAKTSGQPWTRAGKPGTCIVPAKRYWRTSGWVVWTREQSLRQYSDEVLVSITFTGAPARATRSPVPKGAR